MEYGKDNETNSQFKAEAPENDALETKEETGEKNETEGVNEKTFENGTIEKSKDRIAKMQAEIDDLTPKLKAMREIYNLQREASKLEDEQAKTISERLALSDEVATARPNPFRTEGEAEKNSATLIELQTKEDELQAKVTEMRNQADEIQKEKVPNMPIGSYEQDVLATRISSLEDAIAKEQDTLDYNEKALAASKK